MIKSMTGYGKAEAQINDKKISVEIRSLNSKQLDLSVRIPSIYRPFEYELRNRIGKVAQRGKVDVYVNIENNSMASQGASINGDMFASYFESLRKIVYKNFTSSQHLDAALMTAILRLPEVISTENSEVSEEEQAALYGVADEALAKLEEFRAQEGSVLMEDLLSRISNIERGKQEVEPFEARRVELVKTRIRENLESLNIPLDSNRLEQEMIFYIEKLDVTEEKVRLTNHCNYFKEVAEKEENPGRKLGFITQEIGREINTLGSKANDSDIQRIVVQMKDELEKIKEQLLNVL